MSRKILKGYNRIIAFLISLIGIGTSASFTACGPITGGVEYGTPHADFKITGTILNGSNKAVPGIKVLAERDSTLSDKNGEYFLTINAFPKDQTFPIQFIDVDGDKNSELQDIDTIVEFKNPEFKNGNGNWYDGETSKALNVKMDEKE